MANQASWVCIWVLPPNLFPPNPAGQPGIGLGTINFVRALSLGRVAKLLHLFGIIASVIISLLVHE